jgi:hypothetical protein
MPAIAIAEKLPVCPSQPQAGVLKKSINGINGWSSVAREELLANHEKASNLATEIAHTKSLQLLAALKNPPDKKSNSVAGAKIIQTCVYQNHVYVQTWVDDVSIQQAQALKADMAKSLANNPTPRSPNTTMDSKDSESTSELEDLVKDMHRSHQ